MDVFAKCVHFANVSKGLVKMDRKYDVVVSNDIKLTNTLHMADIKLVYRPNNN